MSDEQRDFSYILLIAVLVLIAAVIFKCCGGTPAYGELLGIKEVGI